MKTLILVIIFLLIGSCSEFKESSSTTTTNKSSEHEIHFRGEKPFDPLYAGNASYPRSSDGIEKNSDGSVSTITQKVILTYVLLEDDVKYFEGMFGVDYDYLKLFRKYDPSQLFEGHKLTNSGGSTPIKFEIEEEFITIPGSQVYDFASIVDVDDNYGTYFVVNSSELYAYYAQSIAEYYRQNPNSETEDFNKQGAWHSYVIISPAIFANKNAMYGESYDAFVGINSLGSAYRVANVEKEALSIDKQINVFFNSTSKIILPESGFVNGFVMSSTYELNERYSLNGFPMALILAGSIYFQLAYQIWQIQRVSLMMKIFGIVIIKMINIK